MKKEFENKFESEVKKNITKIEEVINERLAIETKLQVKKAEYAHAKGEVYFSLTEAEGYKEFDKAFRNNAAQRLLFEEARLEVVCGYDEKENAGYFSVEARWDFRKGGHNGGDLFSFWVNF